MIGTRRLYVYPSLHGASPGGAVNRHTHTLTCGTTCIVAAVDSVYTSVSPLAFLAWSHDYCGCHGNEQGGSWQSKDLEIFISERQEYDFPSPPFPLPLPPHTSLLMRQCWQPLHVSTLEVKQQPPRRGGVRGGRRVVVTQHHSIQCHLSVSK